MRDATGCSQLGIWAEVFSSVVEDTKGHVEKKQASTYEELVAEQEAKAEEVGVLPKGVKLGSRATSRAPPQT